MKMDSYCNKLAFRSFAITLTFFILHEDLVRCGGSINLQLQQLGAYKLAAASFLNQTPLATTSEDKNLDQQVTQLFIKALEWSQGISQSHLKSRVLSQIAEGLAKSGNKIQAGEVFSQALNVAKKISDRGSQSYALSDIAKGMAKGGDKAQASDIFDQAIKVAKMIPTYELKEGTLCEIAESLAESGAFSEALEVARQDISRMGSKSHALRGIAWRLAKTGNYTKALEAAREIPEYHPREMALIWIKSIVTESGDFIQALEVVRQIPDEYSWKKEALEKINEMRKKSGDYRKALEAVQGISLEDDKCRELIKIAESMVKRGDKAQAGEVFSQVLNIAREIPNEYSKRHALSEIVKALSRNGEKGKAEEVLSQVLDIARGISVNDLMNGTLIEIAEALAQLKEKGNKDEKTTRGVTIEIDVGISLFNPNSYPLQNGNVVFWIKEKKHIIYLYKKGLEKDGKIILIKKYWGDFLTFTTYSGGFVIAYQIRDDDDVMHWVEIFDQNGTKIKTVNADSWVSPKVLPLNNGGFLVCHNYIKTWFIEEYGADGQQVNKKVIEDPKDPEIIVESDKYTIKGSKESFTVTVSVSPKQSVELPQVNMKAEGNKLKLEIISLNPTEESDDSNSLQGIQSLSPQITFDQAV